MLTCSTFTYRSLVCALLVLLLSACSAMPGGSAAIPSTPVKIRVGMVIVGTSADGGWNTAGVEGLRLLREKFGAEIDYTEVEMHEDWHSAAQPDWAAALEAYATQGYQLVLAHGRYFDATLPAVASRYPQTRFMISGGAAFGENFGSVTLKNEEGGYTLGVLAGLMTQSDTIGVVAGLPMKPILSTTNAFKLGVASVNPDAKVIEMVLDPPGPANPERNFNNPDGANPATEQMIAQGADVIFAHATNANVGIIQTAQRHDVWVVNYAKDLTTIGPKTVLANGLQVIPQMVLRIMEMYQAGGLENQNYVMGFQEDVIKLSPLRDELIPPDVRLKVEEAQAALSSGTLVLEIER